jgi:hypothetical protein
LVRGVRIGNGDDGHSSHRYGVMLQTSSSLAQAPLGTRAIEQDWKVELLVMPDGNRLTSPLFISAFAIPHVSALFQCTWNHRDIPILEEGGIQLQVYKWNNLLDDQEIVTPPWRERLSIDDEVITWTQRLHISDLSYVFTVTNISSKTWDTIPGPYTVKRTFSIWAPPLELYTFNEIARNSGIVMGGNRFKRMVDHPDSLLRRRRQPTRPAGRRKAALPPDPGTPVVRVRAAGCGSGPVARDGFGAGDRRARIGAAD